MARSSAWSFPLFSWLTLILPPLFWAGNFVVGRAVRHDLTPMTLSFWRWVIALICLLPFAFWAMRRDWRRYWELRWQVLRVSVVGVAAFNTLIYVGLRTTTANNALLLNSLIPLLIVMLGACFYHQRLRMSQYIGLILSFAGVLTLVMHGNWSQWQTLVFVPGDAIVLSAMVCWALYTLWLRQLPGDLDRIGLMGVQIVLALVMLLPFYVAEYRSGLRATWGIMSFSALLYVGIFPSVIAYLLYTQAISRFGPARAGLTIHLIPVFGVVLAALFLGERLHAYHAAGIAAIVAGLICSNMKSNQEKSDFPSKVKVQSKK
ncbi:DMT family transporter [Brenneria goodwinii]|uniref:DMT family transporter n=1 Tax=Brenneria goodwinii TaxID=1109412 RepID=UPI000EF23F7A|nr:DMT family transporter [Brenneria goodwinii]MCG8158701.1 DMT family transporter [Brenneria goodwinii]MCG8162922.1 DMT family transporter [Brenneria goodwinii]MCG8167404.1 DMT family transporter [Brenneria goodwinii]MCG8172063.1 DMT family transporter [Brenneria goodwinii]MCG8181610.1 DMT family transporter [Brenneria goodwinii]